MKFVCEHRPISSIPVIFLSRYEPTTLVSGVKWYTTKPHQPAGYVRNNSEITLNMNNLYINTPVLVSAVNLAERSLSTKPLNIHNTHASFCPFWWNWLRAQQGHKQHTRHAFLAFVFCPFCSRIDFFIEWFFAALWICLSPWS